MKTIYLLRHGETTEPHGDRYLGQREISLSDRGRQQITEAAQKLSSLEILSIVCSPLGRCSESAAILGNFLHLHPENNSNFTEINLGEWDGRKREEIKRLYPESYRKRGQDFAHFRVPGGESFSDVQNRVWPAFTALVEESEMPAVIVSHAGVNRVILSKVLGLPLQNLFDIPQEPGCINILCSAEQTAHQESQESQSNQFLARGINLRPEEIGKS